MMTNLLNRLITLCRKSLRAPRATPLRAASLALTFNLFAAGTLLPFAAPHAVTTPAALTPGTAAPAPAAYLMRSYRVNLVPFGLATGLFNGNSNGADLAVLGNPFDLANPNAEVSVLLNNGDGSFRPTRHYAAGRDQFSAKIAVDNFNGFGRRDIAVVNPQRGAVSVLVCNGDGTFQPARQYATGGRPTAIATGDFNKDGKRDIAVTVFSEVDTGGVSILLGNGNGTFQPPRYFRSETNGAQFLLVAHLNADGNHDLVMQGYSQVVTHLGRGDGTFGPPVRTPYEPWAASAAVGDVDGDARQDLVSLDIWQDTAGVLLGNGDGTFRLSHSFPVDADANAVALPDLDNDGRLDFVMSTFGVNNDGEVVVRHGAGGGYFGAAWRYPVGSTSGDLTITDLNRDGRKDIAVIDGSAFAVRLLFNNGNGTF